MPRNARSAEQRISSRRARRSASAVESAENHLTGIRGRAGAAVDLVLAWFATEYLIEADYDDPEFVIIPHVDA
jgi:hypothetical protein